MKYFNVQKMLVATAAMVALTGFGYAEARDADPVARFADGERVAFFGDSITHGGSYHSYLQLYWNTRYPGSGVRLLNCGISGDTATGGVGRFDADLMELKPDRVFLLFGMNDVGIGNYKNESPTESVAAARAESQKRYETSMRTIIGRLAEKGIKTVLMTPTPYDQYSKEPKQPLQYPFGNDPGLTTCAEKVRRLASEHNLGIVELHRPLTALFKSNENQAFCHDRVHPKSEGHMILAALILDAMHVNPYVARVAVDAESGKAFLPSDKNHKDARGKHRPDCFNTRVTHVVKRTDGIAFTYAPKALPFPAIPAYMNAEAFYPLTQKLNQELISVERLPPGSYELAFDGQTVGAFTAEELDKGVNVALLDTPNQRRARAAADQAEKLKQKTGSWRTLINMEKHVLKKAGVDPIDIAAADAYFEKWVGQMEAAKKPYAQYYRNCVNTYRKLRDRKPQLVAEIDDLYEQLNAIRPAVSRVTVKRK